VHVVVFSDMGVGIYVAPFGCIQALIDRKFI
jgi:hypothetical protein